MDHNYPPILGNSNPCMYVQCTVYAVGIYLVSLDNFTQVLIPIRGPPLITSLISLHTCYTLGTGKILSRKGCRVGWKKKTVILFFIIMMILSYIVFFDYFQRSTILKAHHPLQHITNNLEKLLDNLSK